MIELASKFETRRLVEQRGKVEIIAGRVAGHGRMEKPAFFRIDAPEELPIAVQVRMQDPIGRLHRKTLEALAQLA